MSTVNAWHTWPPQEYPQEPKVSVAGFVYERNTLKICASSNQASLVIDMSDVHGSKTCLAFGWRAALSFPHSPNKPKPIRPMPVTPAVMQTAL